MGTLGRKLVKNEENQNELEKSLNSNQFIFDEKSIANMYNKPNIIKVKNESKSLNTTTIDHNEIINVKFKDNSEEKLHQKHSLPMENQSKSNDEQKLAAILNLYSQKIMPNIQIPYDN